MEGSNQWKGMYCWNRRRAHVSRSNASVQGTLFESTPVVEALSVIVCLGQLSFESEYDVAFELARWATDTNNLDDQTTCVVVSTFRAQLMSMS